MSKTKLVDGRANRAQPSTIYYCDNPKELSLLSRKDLSAETWQKIRDLQKLALRHNWRIGLFFALWGIVGWAVLNVQSALVEIFCIVLMGFVVNGLPILMHESCHSLLYKNTLLNRWVGFVCGLPGFVAVSAYRSIHLLHHATTRTEKDPDDIEVNRPKSLPLVIIYYFVLLLGIYVYIFTVAARGFQKAHRAVRNHIIVEYAIMVGVVLLLFVIFPAGAVLKVWLYPLLVAAQLSNVRGLAEHGLTTSGNPFTDSRTVLSNRFVSFMMCNLNYHLEHHLFPGVPWYNLPKVHQLLRQDFQKAGASVYRGYTQFLLDFFRVTTTGIIPNVRLIPKHIREEVCL